ncbi:hypothetical protein MSAN_00934100 [Mycena sanguinolenta]|uniref:Uncharacterized protein n=1 Tax=Mycena sanguinolenta TaxID=230812 RepID=A0A8H6YUT2_9AGAR|nr:hypothetical protein MSAN_00934100 [Mycena sanguinolenta]
MYSHQASGHRDPNSNSALMYTYPPAPVPPARMHTTDINQTSASRSRRSANHHNSSSTYLHPPHATWDAQYNQTSASRTRHASDPNSWSAYLAPPPSSAPAEPDAPATFATLPPRHPSAPI